MFVYMLLLLITAFFAYLTGSISTRRLASRLLFHRNLGQLGRGNVWLSNFQRLFGVPGFVKLGLLEAVKALLPILLGGALLAIKGKFEAGLAFAGFCVMMGRLWPLFNRFDGCHGCVALAMAGLVVEPSVGIAAAAVAAAGAWASKYFSLGALLEAVIVIITSVLVVDNEIAMRLLIASAVLVILRHLPAALRILRGQEEKFSFRRDLTYKLDERF